MMFERLVEESNDGVRTRLRSLAQAFRDLESTVSGLQAGARATLTHDGDLVDPDEGFAVRLRPDMDGGYVALHVSSSGATVTARSSPRRAVRGMGSIQDELNVYLERGFRWAGDDLGTASSLARALLAHMQNRLRMVDEIGPEVRGPARLHESAVVWHVRRGVDPAQQPGSVRTARRSPRERPFAISLPR